jgi:hypothetical protein
VPEKIVFYNNCKNGDIFLTKAFIQDYIDNNSNHDYYFAHSNSPRLHLDITKLKHVPLFDGLHPGLPFINGPDYLGINTWIGRDRKYVLGRDGCTLEMLYAMYKEMGLTLKEDVYSYLPVFDFSYYQISGIDDHVAKFLDKKKILICNGRVTSEQSMNFDFTPVIKRIAIDYPDKLFYLTAPINSELPENVYLAKDVIGELPCDLVEIGYLSTFCDVIIGRSSGPFMYTQHRPNWYDPTKTFLSFTYTIQASHFVLGNGLPAKKMWSPATDENGIYTKIKEALD